jgi:hypothetical protein
VKARVAELRREAQSVGRASMDERADKSRAAIGFTVKSGWAAAVLLHGPLTLPQVIDSRRIELSDPAISESRQPYHAGFGTARAGGPELSRLLRAVRRFGAHSVAGVIRQHTASGHQLIGAGVVVGSLIDPESIANAHIQIHAREGRLFRGVIEDAATAAGLPCTVWRERDLYGLAAEKLEQSEQDVRSAVGALGNAVTGAWRIEQKAATVAAWLVLAASGRATRSVREAHQQPDSERQSTSHATGVRAKSEKRRRGT